jgi:hypothetical protein
MTEQEWLQTDHLHFLLSYLEGKLFYWQKPDTAPDATDRKMRLFACASCRRIWDQLDGESRHVLEITEAFADALVDEELLVCWRKCAIARQQTNLKPLGNADLFLLYASMSFLGENGELWESENGHARQGELTPLEAHALYTASWSISAVINATYQVWPKESSQGHRLGTTQVTRLVAKARAGVFPSHFQDALQWTKAVTRETAEHKALLRHIVGNPFRPFPAPSTWPTSVVQLADALYRGEECRLPLSDALEEAGHAELAEHFRKEEWHPKGCWVVDLLLKRE